MGAYIDSIINGLISQFDFAYMFGINIITYIFIQLWDSLNGDKLLTTWQKRLMMLLATIISLVAYKICHYSNDIVLFNSTVAAPVFWSWVLKPILTKFGIGYKRIDDCLS